MLHQAEPTWTSAHVDMSARGTSEFLRFGRAAISAQVHCIALREGQGSNEAYRLQIVCGRRACSALVDEVRFRQEAQGHPTNTGTGNNPNRRGGSSSTLTTGIIVAVSNFCREGSDVRGD